MFSKSNHKLTTNYSIASILAALSILSVITYLVVSRLYFRLGFPLDDSWIHQTYARNLATFGEWAFLPGETSGGSTSPLWTAILSFGYVLHIPPLVWTFGMGILLLWMIAYFVEITSRRLVVHYIPTFPWVGLIILLEWHLTWAAVSGMETLFFSGMVIWVLISLVEETPKYLKIGILIGISIWIRPEGLTLLGPAFMVAILGKSPFKKRIKNIAKILIGFLGVFSLYILFSLALSGTPFPTTFYAKQAEYKILSDLSLLDRFGNLLVQLWVGVGSILLPGFILILVNAIRKRKWGYLAGLFWVLGMLVIYAWRLPVVYQHARYLIPTMLVFIAFSFIGIMDYFQKPFQGWRWVIGTTWKIGIGIILIIFWGYGSIVYARDVAVIESEMVESANWVNKNLPEKSLIAAHDIGALGYFGNHRIIDLAGLISPEVIPFLRDETHLTEYLDAQNVDYLITFPDWYPLLTKDKRVIHTTNGKFAPSLGSENMAIYQWKLK